MYFLHHVFIRTRCGDVTHPLLIMLSMLTTNGDIVGLHLPSRAILVDNSFMFLQALHENLEKGMLGWNQVALAAKLHINWWKYSLISCIEQDLEYLG